MFSFAIKNTSFLYLVGAFPEPGGALRWKKISGWALTFSEKMSI